MMNFNDLDYEIERRSNDFLLHLRLENEVALYNYKVEAKIRETVNKHMEFVRVHGVVLVGNNKLQYRKAEVYPEPYDPAYMQRDLMKYIGYNRTITDIHI